MRIVLSFYWRSLSGSSRAPKPTARPKNFGRLPLLGRGCKPKITKDFSQRSHFTEEWPTLEDLAESCRQAAPRSRVLSGDDAAWELQKGGDLSPQIVDRDNNLPFLRVEVEERRVFVARCGTLYFVLLNCTTESASQWIKPHPYGIFSFLVTVFS